ncbi:putative phosphate transport system substrate-binding protein [Magnetofaba australis IT-1]|uniref:Putative phosphate transport system substrate-binding protein n=1 Tax=Magnetofaba australis IT-1 TaxID=1434232 RepID=A0A1Y2K549_9PROT|nr:putative phosphate transport system substrate-binding protein [Magnetofaba australis IT-1]
MEIVGTGDGMIVLHALAKAFSVNHPQDEIVVPDSIGSSGGYKAVGNDKALLGRVARKIKPREEPYGLTYLPIAKFPVVFFVNKSVTVSNLSAAQINDIYRGKIVNWSEVGGAEGKIRVVRREEGDSSLGNLRATFPGFDEVTITPYSKTATLNQHNFEIVTQKEGTIGFGPYADALKENVTILNIDGLAPTDENYPSFGTLALIFKAANRQGLVEAFLKFVETSPAMQAIRSAHATPYK